MEQEQRVQASHGRGPLLSDLAAAGRARCCAASSAPSSSSAARLAPPRGTPARPACRRKRASTSPGRSSQTYAERKDASSRSTVRVYFGSGHAGGANPPSSRKLSCRCRAILVGLPASVWPVSGGAAPLAEVMGGRQSTGTPLLHFAGRRDPHLLCLRPALVHARLALFAVDLIHADRHVHAGSAS